MVINLIDNERTSVELPFMFRLWDGTIEESGPILRYLREMPKEIRSKKLISITFGDQDIPELIKIILGDNTIVY